MASRTHNNDNCQIFLPILMSLFKCRFTHPTTHSGFSLGCHSPLLPSGETVELNSLHFWIQVWSYYALASEIQAGVMCGITGRSLEDWMSHWMCLPALFMMTEMPQTIPLGVRIMQLAHHGFLVNKTWTRVALDPLRFWQIHYLDLQRQSQINISYSICPNSTSYMPH